jgi:(1->4)-alpha-D-glucan 1-alpha-D-glucosylmutase
MEDGRLKLHVIHASLAARRRSPEAFASGVYQPIEAEGEGAERLVAFARGEGDARLLAAVARFHSPEETAGSTGAWSGTTLLVPVDAPRRWTCALTGASHEVTAGRLQVADLFRILPAALLLAEPGTVR